MPTVQSHKSLTSRHANVNVQVIYTVHHLKYSTRNGAHVIVPNMLIAPVQALWIKVHASVNVQRTFIVLNRDS